MVIAAAAILSAANLFRGPDPSAPVDQQTVSLGSDAVNLISSGVPTRANYRYSVIAGGALDAQELTRAVKRDPVVAEHYRGLDPATMRTETLAADRFAYVSYRIDDRVYWTKRKLRIRGGETILTNGQVEIRSRCGNCISMEPMLPTAADEPDPSQFDALTDTGPTLVSWNLAPAGVPLAVSAPPGDLSDTTGLGSMPGIPVVPLGIAIFSGGPVTNVPTTNPPGGSPQGGLPDLPPAVITTPPGGVSPPAVGGPPGTQLPGGDSELPLVLDGLLNDANPATPSPPLPSDTTPVPEPATFLLLGSGIAGLLARRWRVKRI